MSAKYKVLVKSFIANAIYEEGAIISAEKINGKPGSNLELIEEEKREAKPAKVKE